MEEELNVSSQVECCLHFSPKFQIMNTHLNLRSQFAILRHTSCSKCIGLVKGKPEALPFRQAINSNVLTVSPQQSMSMKPCTALNSIGESSTSISSKLIFNIFRGGSFDVLPAALFFAAADMIIAVCVSLDCEGGTRVSSVPFISASRSILLFCSFSNMTWLASCDRWPRCCSSSAFLIMLSKAAGQIKKVRFGVWSRWQKICAMHGSRR